MASNGGMIEDSGIRKDSETSGDSLIEELGKSNKYFDLNSGHPGRDSNRAPLEHEPRASPQHRIRRNLLPPSSG
jgi:hypothetical protein